MPSTGWQFQEALEGEISRDLDKQSLVKGVTMGDSWEDSPAPPPVKPATLLQRGQPKGTGLNPNASSFSFSPGAASFVPGGASQPAKPPPGFTMPTYPPPPGGSAVSSSGPGDRSLVDPEGADSSAPEPAAAANHTNSNEVSTSSARPSAEPSRETGSSEPADKGIKYLGFLRHCRHDNWSPGLTIQKIRDYALLHIFEFTY